MATENTNTAFIKIQPITELEEITTLEPGNFLFEDGDGTLKRMTTDNFYQILNNFARPIAPSDAGPFTADRWYKPTTSSADPGTNYPNAGNLKAKNGFDTLFWYNGSTWTKTEVALPESVFISKTFTAEIDLTSDNYSIYKEITGLITFSEGSGSKFGKIAYVKLTGGTVVFPSNFVSQSGSATYDPSKTNVITFWKEYNKVRYFVEVFNLEPVLIDGVLSYYNFNGKPANTLLSAITPDTGVPLTGDTGDYRMNTAGTYLERINNVAALSDSITLNTAGLQDFKISIVMNSPGESDFVINGTNGTDYTRYINVTPPSNFIKLITPEHPTGLTLATPTGIPTTPSLWEFTAMGNQVTLYINSILMCAYTNDNTGSWFSLLQTGIGAKIQSFKVEEI